MNYFIPANLIAIQIKILTSILYSNESIFIVNQLSFLIITLKSMNYHFFLFIRNLYKII